ncbi:MAG: Dephospho-CoA kinase, partial [Pseudomonadota bacterium]
MTGGIGSGKSEALKIFESLNIKVIDLDKISKEITETDHQAIEEIKSAFGNVFDKDNQLDRKKLRELIFSDNNQKIILEKILHPKILKEVKKKLNTLSDESYVVIDIPLLFETNQYTSLISRSLVIDCEVNDQIERVKKRDSIDTSIIQSIMNQQIDR